MNCKTYAREEQQTSFELCIKPSLFSLPDVAWRIQIFKQSQVQ